MVRFFQLVTTRTNVGRSFVKVKWPNVNFWKIKIQVIPEFKAYAKGGPKSIPAAGITSIEILPIFHSNGI